MGLLQAPCRSSGLRTAALRQRAGGFGSPPFFIGLTRGKAAGSERQIGRTADRRKDHAPTGCLFDDPAACRPSAASGGGNGLRRAVRGAGLFLTEGLFPLSEEVGGDDLGADPRLFEIVRRKSGRGIGCHVGSGGKIALPISGVTTRTNGHSFPACRCDRNHHKCRSRPRPLAPQGRRSVAE